MWHRAKSISKHYTFNIKMKVMRPLPIYKDSDGDYNRFKEVMNATDLLKGINNDMMFDDDEVYELVQSLWSEVESTIRSREDGLFIFFEYLVLIKSNVKGFTYQLSRSSDDTSQSRKKSCQGLYGKLQQYCTILKHLVTELILI